MSIQTVSFTRSSGGNLNLFVDDTMKVKTKIDVNMETGISIYENGEIKRITNGGDVLGERKAFVTPDELHDLLAQVAAADGNAKDLTKSDIISFAQSKKGGNIKDIQHDKENGIVTIITKSDKVLEFDYETAAEEQARTAAELQEEANKLKKERQANIDNMFYNCYGENNYHQPVVDENGYVTFTLKDDRSYEDVLKDFQLTEKQLPPRVDEFPEGHKIVIPYNDVNLSNQSTAWQRFMAWLEYRMLYH